MTQQSCTIRTYSVKVGVTGTGADATFVMKIRIKNFIALARPQARPQAQREAAGAAARHVARRKNPRTNIRAKLRTRMCHVRIDSHPLTARASCGFY